MTKLIVGCGYLGCCVAHRWLQQGHVVYGWNRSASPLGHLLKLGLRPLIGDWTCADRLPALPEADTLLCCVSWNQASGQDLHQVYVQGLRNLLDNVPRTVRRFLYISSTGVYGQIDGRWVDEHTECSPRRAGGRVRVTAEQVLSRSRWAGRSVILRLAGIYGPDRLPRWGDVSAGRSLSVDPEGLLNLIHVEDATEVILRAAERPVRPLPRVFLVADGHPVRRRAFYSELARLTGSPAPRFAAPKTGSGTIARSGACKRVCNRRMLREFDIRLHFPTYREGLTAIVDSPVEGPIAGRANPSRFFRWLQRPV